MLNAGGNPVISYYDGTNGDLRLALCDDPTCTNILANPGFEAPLAAWTTGDDARRFETGQAFAGDAVLLLTGSGAQAFATQTLPLSGEAGDVLRLDFHAGGRSVDPGGTLGARLDLFAGGVLVSSTDCKHTVPGATFTWTPFACAIIASAPYDTIRVSVGAQGIGSGFIGFDSVFLTQD
ncbi:MAG: hypothetical protein ACFB51_11630 [Anaerolineae bacterium]